jgi:hypothetical protein
VLVTYASLPPNPNRNNFKKERFLLALAPRVTRPHVLGQNIIVVGACGRGGCPPHGKQEAEGEDELGARYELPGHTTRNSFPPARTHHLMFLAPLK